MTLETTIAAILSVLGEIAEREGDDEPVPTPRPPASADAIAAAERARSTVFPEPYRRFLELHDGWPSFPWGLNLFGAGEFVGDGYEWVEEVLEIANEDGDLPEELATAMIIANSDNDSSLVLLLAGGAVVDFRYEELDRHADFGAFLSSRLDGVREYLADLLGQEAAARDDWSAEHRAAKEARLRDELRQLAPASAPPPAEVPAARDPMPPAVDPAELVAGRKKPRASVALNLVLYLGAYPSPDEVVGCFRAFRRQFPVDGTMAWELPSTFGSFPNDAEHPDDESWAQAMRIDVAGHYGIRLSIKTGKTKPRRRYTLNVRGIPPSDDDDPRPRASFCEVIVPVDEDPAHLVRLAEELTALLPVRSGHGGYSAYAWKPDHDKDPYRDIFAWCRRFLALDVGYLDGWLEAMPSRVLGAGWLTILGPTFVGFLGAPEFTAPGTTVTRTPAGLVIRAGDRPTLGDVERGEFPTALAEIDRYLSPLKVGGWHRTSIMFTAGHAWQLTADELPGGFTDHRATAAWLNRLIEPERFLGPSARERGEALLDRLSTEHVGKWRADPDHFSDLLRLLTDAAYGADDNVAALEFVTAFPDDAPARAFNNLLYAYLLRNDLDRALSALPAALAHAERNPSIFHNAACVVARAGDHGRALEFVRAAKQHGYDGFAAMRTDEDLHALRDDPEFTALFQ